MTTRGEADHADLLRVGAPLLRLAPHQADSSLSVLERTGGRHSLDVARPARTAILEDDASDADRVEPGGDFFALDVPAQVVIAAAGTDQHRRSGVFVLR